MTMGPGGGSDPGNAGRGGRSGGNSGGGTGGDGRPSGGFDGRDTPGSPNAPDGKRGSTMGRDGGRARGTGGGRGDNTPGSPGNPGRIGRNANGSTPSSRARDAMSRHQRERDARSIAKGGTMVGDNDQQTGLGLTHAMDSQQTENSLNQAGFTDTVGMNNADRLGAAVNAGAALSNTERQQAEGIVAGHSNQFTANRINDVMSAVPGLNIATGLISQAVVGESRPPNTMAVDYNEGRERANATELGTLGETILGYGLSKAGVTTPMGPVNFGQAIVRDTAKNSSIASLRKAGFGPDTESTRRASQGGTARSALQAMRKNMPPTTANRNTTFSWDPVNVQEYSRGLLSLAQES